MARVKDPNKEPGRLKQIWQVFRMTQRADRWIVWLLLASFVLPIAAGIVLAIVASPWAENPVGFVLWIILGLFSGMLISIIVLGQRAKKVAYDQIIGKPGAVGAVIQNDLGRRWIGNEMPVNISPKTQDAVYRVVGPGGVVIIGEGPRSRTQRMVDDERRKVARILPSIPINTVFVGPDEDATPLMRIPAKLRTFKRVLRKQEVLTVVNRLQSLGGKNLMPIPKGIDPMKVRAQRAR